MRGAVALPHEPRPEASRGAKFRRFLEEVVVRVEEEGDALGKGVDVKTRGNRRIEIRDGIREGERDFLDCRRSGLADVIAAHRDGVPLRHLAFTEGEDIRHNPQRGFRRKNICSPRDIFLEDVVL
jgi:hypothetical protein